MEEGPGPGAGRRGGWKGGEGGGGVHGRDASGVQGLRAHKEVPVADPRGQGTDRASDPVQGATEGAGPVRVQGPAGGFAGGRRGVGLLLRREVGEGLGEGPGAGWPLGLIVFIFIYLFIWLRGTRAPCIGRQSLNHSTTREFPRQVYLHS